MSDSEKTSFLADNAELFEGPDGQKLLEAIKSGDYNFIQNALGDNKTLKDKVAQQIKDIDTEIAIENAKLEADRDYAYIAYLEEQKKLLQDSDNLYAASLDVRLEQEKKYLDEYKSYLEDQRDALKESLDKRKEAYSDYFESINQQADDEDFEEKESTLIANISKLATSGSADAVNQQAKLEQELAQLEKERLEELRQRAQDAVMDTSACVSLFSCVPISGGIIKETSRYIKKHNDTPKTSLKHFMRKVFFMFDSISPSKSFFPELLILSAKLTYL